MSSVRRIICLANSWKHQERCIAGIDYDTGRWIRPVCDDSLNPKDGRVPRFVRLVQGREPELLDILEIRLDDTGPNFGFECENLSILPGQWNCLGKANITDIPRECLNFEYILHNSRKYVNPSDLKKLPLDQRRTLQLVKTNKFSIHRDPNDKGQTKWKGTIETANGCKLEKAPITDPEFVHKLNSRYPPSPNCLITVPNCLVTVSLGMPWAPPNWEGEPPCWKLIAGVIEL
ncbi:hypothetical protein NG796_13045 [Laspinema sp. A4]|uniref:dual OB domain-containing protein n=1 Tax=Laspinema sp. D2d TaxID=2953686 RepID=UPI0021BB54D8|nr:hypothetical protein [Laspinema sp. D2d]MCT7984222.1 hypothetical protein [Laspinema sp. D2d]